MNTHKKIKKLKKIKNKKRRPTSHTCFTTNTQRVHGFQVNTRISQHHRAPSKHQNNCHVNASTESEINTPTGTVTTIILIMEAHFQPN